MVGEGWKSRKLGLALITQALIFVAWVLCGRPAGLFGELCMALLGAAGIYKGSNLADKWMDSKKGQP